jgi:hypothetical protein
MKYSETKKQHIENPRSTHLEVVEGAKINIPFERGCKNSFSICCIQKI